MIAAAWGAGVRSLAVYCGDSTKEAPEDPEKEVKDPCCDEDDYIEERAKDIAK